MNCAAACPAPNLKRPFSPFFNKLLTPQPEAPGLVTHRVQDKPNNEDPHLLSSLRQKQLVKLVPTRAKGRNAPKTNSSFYSKESHEYKRMK